MRIKTVVDDGPAQCRKLDAQLVFAAGDGMQPIQGLRAFVPQQFDMRFGIGLALKISQRKLLEAALAKH